MNPQNTLPTDLAERRRLCAFAVALMDLLFDRPIVSVTPWEPELFADDSSSCPAVVRNTAPPLAPVQIKFSTPLQAYNLRLVKIAEAVEPLSDALRIAGLDKEDVELWRSHQLQAGAIRKQPDGVSVATDKLLFVHDARRKGIFTQAKGSDAKSRQRLASSRKVLDRLRRAVIRIERTVSPQAILDRLHVSDDRTEVILDGVSYKPLLPKSEGAYLYYLRMAAGEWVSSATIAFQLGIKEFKVTRPNKTLDEKFKPLRAIIESEGGDGGRIVLPLFPQ